VRLSLLAKPRHDLAHPTFLRVDLPRAAPNVEENGDAVNKTVL
jgi:hypothetical protein